MENLTVAAFKHPDTQEVCRLFGELAEQYNAELAQHYGINCSHSDTEVRAKTIKGGGIQCKEQCKICGAPVGNPKKKQEGLPKWDEDLPARYKAARDQQLADMQRKYTQLSAEEDANLLEESQDLQAQYSAYRRTPAWQSKRARVLRRTGGVCEGCLQAQATEIHHLTYANIGDELLFQLVALCRACHEKVHPEHNEPPFWDNDYVPCTQCRWGDGGVHCGKFEVPAYEALEVGGPCGPTGKAFEGLK